MTMITRITDECSLHASGSVKGFVQMIVLVLTPLDKEVFLFRCKDEKTEA